MRYLSEEAKVYMTVVSALPEARQAQNQNFAHLLHTLTLKEAVVTLP